MLYYFYLNIFILPLLIHCYIYILQAKYYNVPDRIFAKNKVWTSPHLH